MKIVTIASASIVSVLLAVSLVVASIAYFPSGPPTITTTTTSIQVTTQARVTMVTTTVNLSHGFTLDCSSLLKTPPELNLPPNSTLKDNGTAVIGGTTYWYASFILGNLSTVYFHGVKFAFNSTQGPIIMGAETTVNNATMLTLSAVAYYPPVSGPSGCATGYFLPQITITFPDGSSVIYNEVHVKVTTATDDFGRHRTFIVTTYDKPPSNPWFTQHVSPQAGVGYETDGGEMTLYVSK